MIADGVVGAVYEFTIDRGYAGDNPSLRVKASTIAVFKPRERSLSEKEIGFFNALGRTRVTRMTKHNRFPPEVRQRTIHMILENQDEYNSQYLLHCSQNGCTSETLRIWICQPSRTELILRGNHPGQGQTIWHHRFGDDYDAC